MTHPLQQFAYCPKCGSREFSINNEKSKRCASCGFVYYFNPSSAVACFIVNPRKEILLVRRAKEPAKGTLDLPGGFCDLQETAEQSAIREVKEETNLDVVSPKYLYSIPNIYLYSGFEVHTLDMFFLCEVESFEGAKAADDAAEIVVLPIRSLDASEFGLSSVSKGVKKFIESYED